MLKRSFLILSIITAISSLTCDPLNIEIPRASEGECFTLQQVFEEINKYTEISITLPDDADTGLKIANYLHEQLREILRSPSEITASSFESAETEALTRYSAGITRLFELLEIAQCFFQPPTPPTSPCSSVSASPETARRSPLTKSEINLRRFGRVIGITNIPSFDVFPVLVIPASDAPACGGLKPGRAGRTDRKKSPLSPKETR